MNNNPSGKSRTNLEIRQFAQQYHAMLLNLAPPKSGIFKTLTTIQVGEGSKPLLLVGNAHSNAGDGECIVILNPKKALLKEVQPGVAYASGVLKKIVAGRCDQMFHFWFDHYKKGASQVTLLDSYKAKTTIQVEVTARDL